MLVKCRCCGNKIDRNIAYKTTKGKKNEYYCSEKEYINMLFENGQKRKLKDDIYNLITEVFGYEVISTSLYNEWAEWNKTFENDIIFHYIQDNVDYLSKVLSKEFKSEYAKIRYFSAIVKNNLQDYKNNRKEEINREYIIEDFKSVYKQKKRKSMEEIEDEVNGN